jgi:putative hydrolase of the HAD superfamily
MPTKTIFFDLYQTLINVDASKEEEGRKVGFEKVIIPYLQQKGILDKEAVLVSQYYFDDVVVFYKDHEQGLFQHNFSVILSNIFSREYGLTLLEAEMSDLLYEFRKISRGFLVLYEGVREVLEALSKDYVLAVASHTQGVYTERELEELDILKYFKYRIYSSDIGFNKKSDNFYEECLKVVGSKAEDCIMVGDNIYEDVCMGRIARCYAMAEFKWIING